MPSYSNLERGVGPGSQDSDCPICQVPFSPSDSTAIHIPGCRRTFHETCLLPWLNGLFEQGDRITCPMCRGDLPPPARLEEIINELIDIEHASLSRLHRDPTSLVDAEPVPQPMAHVQELFRELLDHFADVDTRILNNRLEAARQQRHYTIRPLPSQTTSLSTSVAEMPTSPTRRSTSTPELRLASTSTPSPGEHHSEDYQAAHTAIMQELAQIRVDLVTHLEHVEHVESTDGRIAFGIIQWVRDRLIAVLDLNQHVPQILCEHLQEIMHDIYVLIPEHLSNVATEPE